MADIIKHAEFEDTYDDPEHPIPSLTHLEVCTILKGGGAELHIVISKPLEADEYSLTRLLDKIEAYLGHIQTEEFRKEAGEPSPNTTAIVVDIHPDSSNEAFDLLDNAVDWVNQNGASLIVKRLNDD